MEEALIPLVTLVTFILKAWLLWAGFIAVVVVCWFIFVFRHFGSINNTGKVKINSRRR